MGFKEIGLVSFLLMGLIFMDYIFSCLVILTSNNHSAAAAMHGGGRGEGRNLPEVVLLRHPQHFNLTDTPFPTDSFRFLKPFESPHLSLPDFLTLHCASAEALLTSGGFPVPYETISRLPSLRLVLTTSAGLNHIDLPECRRRGIAVASAGDVYSSDVADFAVGLLIDVLRRVSAADRWVRSGKWREGCGGEYPLGFKLRGKRVGIVGLGRIGLQVAKRLEPFGCKIVYTSRKEKQSFPYKFYPNALELSSNCDGLIICSELNDETHHMINKQVMLALGKDGVIVNIGRGTIVDEEEMVKLLIQGELGGVGLDVFENEPHVPDQLLAMDNVVLSPHKAVLTPESMLDICKLMIGNLEAFFSNRPLLSPVLLDE